MTPTERKKALACADSLTIDRISFLHPKIRKRVLDKYLYINYKLLGRGVRLRFAYTYRSGYTQNSLYKLGREVLYTPSGHRQGIVTYAKAGQSTHNYGLAWDIVLLLDKDRNGTFETASWDVVTDFDGDMKSDWMEVVNAFNEIDEVEWGGTWRGKRKDRPHLQITFGLGWREMRDKIKSGDYTEETIEGVVYKWINI